MKTNGHSENLAETIAFLESRQRLEWLDIKDQVTTIKENLKPLNVLKTVVGEIKDTLGIGGGSNSNNNGLLKIAVGLGTEYLIHKVVAKKSNSKLWYFMGPLLSFGATKVVDRLKNN